MSDLRDRFPPRKDPPGPLRMPAPRLPKKPKPINKVNRARREARNAMAFGPQARACRLMPCAVCGKKPSDPAHVVSRGAGGKDSDCAPLCRAHHREQHEVGVATFQARHGIALDVVAADLAAAIKQHECAGWIALTETGKTVCAICEREVDDREVTP